MGRVSCIIPAAGLSTRMGNGMNKLRLHLGGQPLISYAISEFERCEAVDEIVLVVRRDDQDWIMKEVMAATSASKVVAVVEGGKTRQESVRRGLSYVSEGCDIVVIHDGARPFVTQSLIQDVLVGAREHGASVCAVPVKDTIKEVSEDGFVLKTLNRSVLWAVQTPQAFEKSILTAAHRLAEREGLEGTDDASLVEHYGFPVKIVPGTYENIKVTTKEDLYLAAAILSGRTRDEGRNWI